MLSAWASKASVERGAMVGAVLHKQSLRACSVPGFCETNNSHFTIDLSCEEQECYQ